MTATDKAITKTIVISITIVFGAFVTLKIKMKKMKKKNFEKGNLHETRLNCMK